MASLLQGSTVELKDSTITNVGGDTNIIQLILNSHEPLTERQVNSFKKFVAGVVKIPEGHDMVTKNALSQSIRDLPRVKAAHDDYTSTSRRHNICLEGTRQVLLEEIGGWVFTSDGSRIYVLSGLAGIGKSTVAQTVAKATDRAHLLAASFFFSRDDAERKTADRFFTTIAFQLCVYDPEFAQAIGNVLLTEKGSSAMSKAPEVQLEVLILGPLREVVKRRSRPVLIVVDALDECNDDEAITVLEGLNWLVQVLPSFKIVLTTRPLPRIQYFLNRSDTYTIFHLQDIEDKVVDDDIRLYLRHNLSEDQVRARLPTVKVQWCAHEEDIEALVRAADRLFIIASTAVHFLLDKATRNPEAQMKRLRTLFSQNLTRFDALNGFYTVILRTAVPKDCGHDLVECYQAVIGTLLFIKIPLPVAALAKLIDRPLMDQVRPILGDLQPVLWFSGDKEIPLAYHKSFPDYITDKDCTESDLRIIPKDHHTRITTYCLRTMNSRLKQNLLDLGVPARFMDNADALEAAGMSDRHIQKKLSPELQYACIFFAKHLEDADSEDMHIAKGLKTFANEHLLHWFEVLSWMRKLNVAHVAAGVVLRLSTPATTAVHAIFSDALRFISKFHIVAERAALHIYYSALTFTPVQSVIYKVYHQSIEQKPCTLESIDEGVFGTPPFSGSRIIPRWRRGDRGQASEVAIRNGALGYWNPLIAIVDHGRVDRVGFLSDSCQFTTFNSGDAGFNQELKLWDAINGSPIRTFTGKWIALAQDLSVVALSGNTTTIALFNARTKTPRSTISISQQILSLVISSDGTRVVAGLSNQTVSIWDTRNGELIANLDDCHRFYRDYSDIIISPNGERLAYLSGDGNDIKLFNAVNGQLIANLSQPKNKHISFVLTHNGSRLASVSWSGDLTIWDVNGNLVNSISRRTQSYDQIAVSSDDSLFFTRGYEDFRCRLDVWSSDGLICSFSRRNSSLFRGRFRSPAAALTRSIFAVAWDYQPVKLYDLQKGTCTVTLDLNHSFMSLAFSPDGTRLAGATDSGVAVLWDMKDIQTFTSTSTSKPNKRSVQTSAFSPDCSRLALGRYGGRIELWDTAHSTSQAIATHKVQSSVEHMLTFSPDGQLLVSATQRWRYEKGSIRIYDGGDVARTAGTLRFPVGELLLGAAVSDALLIALTRPGYPIRGIVFSLWDRKTLKRITAFEIRGTGRSICSPLSHNRLSFSANDSHLVYSTDKAEVLVVDIRKHTKVLELFGCIAWSMFSHDGSRLAVQRDDGHFMLFDIENGTTTQLQTLGDLTWLPAVRWDRFIASLAYKDRRIEGRISGQDISVPLLWIPKSLEVRSVTYGSSMIALHIADGITLLIRFASCF